MIGRAEMALSFFSTTPLILFQFRSDGKDWKRTAIYEATLLG